MPDDPHRVVAAASQLLSDLTHFAGIVVSPRRRGAVLRHVEFFGLSEKRVLLIIVASDGEVQNRVLVTDRRHSPSQLVEAANYINQHYAGTGVRPAAHQGARRAARPAPRHLGAHAGRDRDRAAKRCAQPADGVVISGGRNLLEVDDLSGDMQRLRRLFDLFESKTQLLDLLEQSERAEGVKIFIGGESQLVPLDECSIVTAPYEVDGQVVGTVGVIGPTRMAYERVIPIVDVTAKLVSSALSQH